MSVQGVRVVHLNGANDYRSTILTSPDVKYAAVTLITKLVARNSQEMNAASSDNADSSPVRRFLSRYQDIKISNSCQRSREVKRTRRAFIVRFGPKL
ncbi:hypothetical protein SeMB42_g01145 [Synchytrium endobioticum]|uniref:Uncharacterized protein n=1 Tax=Synchytrium endobioticum TaxID=286115 RepID=A0A507D3P1_9FUNG|nr:hypothetical protein SeLEV6574_g03560 [Synchytrium endobioticum]TPX52816.1 hypothetical protein SeMB42_g01145 [Synchytrium endobioticum]